VSAAIFTLFEAGRIIKDSRTRRNRYAPDIIDLAAPAQRGYTAPDEEASEALNSQ
jgi:hypothetical protein